MKKQTKNLLILAGDGIGPEIIAEAMRVFDFVKERSAYDFEISTALIGGAAYEKHQNHFPEETKVLCEKADLILFGAVGGPVNKQQEPKWHKCEVNSILALRKLLDLYANIRPVKIDQALLHNSPLRLEKFLPLTPDLVILRELSGDIYFGDKGRRENNSIAYDEATYSIDQVKRIAKVAFEIASNRNQILHSIDKANVLETSRLWREVVDVVSLDYPKVKYETMLVDNCAMQLINDPTVFDVILTSNMFGDILSDAAAVIPGSLGLLASASYGVNSQTDKATWLFEPPSGSAPDIAGLGIANPIGMIRCIGLMFQMALNEPHIYKELEDAISNTLLRGIVTSDLIDPNSKAVSTKDFTENLIQHL